MSSSINVLFISSGGTSGKATPIIINQLNSLIDKGCNVTLYTINRGIISYISNVFKLRSYLSKNSFDILHAHYGWSGIVAFLTRRKIPIIVSFMGDDLIGVVGKNNRYTLSGSLITRLNGFLARNCYAQNIVKSTFIKDRIRNGRNVSVIPNGVDLSKFQPMDQKTARQQLQLNFEFQYILWISDPSRPEKNYGLAQKAIKLLEPSKVRLLTVYNKSNDELIPYYSAADCLLVTSIHEGSPNVVKEAMACNLPIVSTDVGDVKWIFGTCEGCYICSYNMSEIADKLIEALQYRKINSYTAGRERIKVLGLSSDRIASQIIELYNKVLN